MALLVQLHAHGGRLVELQFLLKHGSMNRGARFGKHNKAKINSKKISANEPVLLKWFTGAAFCHPLTLARTMTIWVYM